MNDKRILAFDFGASSGRAMLGHFDGNKIELEEIHRFTNDPVLAGGTLYWDILRLLHEVRQALLKLKTCGPADSLGIDTWGVDFGLIDHQGYLLENPVHYRDSRTLGAKEEIFKVIPRAELYGQTGIQIMDINTIFQLYSLKMHRPDMLQRAARLLMMPDLFLYFLTGQQYSEKTIASTGQLLDPASRTWAFDLLGRLGLPSHFLCPLVEAGTLTWPLQDSLCSELGIGPIPTIAVTSHDTASAVVAVPTGSDDFIYISSGTWSLMGIESPVPLINDQTYTFNLTNEGGYRQTTRLLKNIMGLWLIQESRRQWIREGENVTYAGLEQEALASDPFRSLIDPDDASLVSHGDMPGRIRALCRQNGQPVPRSRGEIVRCIYESLALKYRVIKNQIEKITDRSYPILHVVGGGAKDGLLSQFTANACSCPVLAGPTEATALGNIAVQLITLGAVDSLEQARQVIAASSQLQEYQPQDEQAWQQALGLYQALYPV